MVYTSIRLSLLLLFFIGIMCSCNKAVDKPQLPPETDTGANTFGCTIDGAVFVPQGTLAMIQPLNLRYEFRRDTPFLSMSASNLKTDQKVMIGMNAIWITRDTVIHFKKLGVGSLAGSYSNGNDDASWYETLDSPAGELHIKRFEPGKSISGTFWFDAKNTAGKVVKIREGRFDF